MKLRQPLKWMGGKYYLSRWLHSLAALHTHRVYLYAGGLGERWEWPRENVSEVANDLHGYLINFYRVLQQPASFKKFQEQARAIPFSRVEWEDSNEIMKIAMKKTPPEAYRPPQPNVNMAVDFFVWNRQSMSGLMKTFAPTTRTRTRGGRNAEANAWCSVVDGLPEVHDSLRGMFIEQDDALNVLRREDDKKTLFYADPTYLMSEDALQGRSTKNLYHCESGREHHEALLEILARGIKGKFMLSGYDNTLYDKVLTSRRGWKKHTKVIDNKAAKGSEKRKMVEVCWVNF